MNTSISAVTIFIGGMITAGTGFCAGHDEARALREAGTIMPLEKIMSRPHSHRIANILEAELEHEGSGYYYEVELIDDAGVVHKHIYDAESGELIRDSLEN